MENTLDTSWLHGKYPEINAEINTRLPYVAIGDDYFAQGDNADRVIAEIHEIWTSEDCTEQEAIQKWASYYLC